MSDRPTRGRPRTPDGRYNEPNSDTQQLARDHDGRRSSSSRGPRPDTPIPGAQEYADAWVRQGVERLARTAPPDDHVVLMASTHEATGRVGAAGSIRCGSEAAMGALGRLVAEVNEAFLRDDVRVRVELRMREINEDDGRAYRALSRGLVKARRV